MSKRKARNTGRPIASTRPGPLRTSKSKAPFWRNRKVWLGGAAGTVITGVVTGILVNISVNELAAHKIASSPAPMLTLSLPGLAKKSPISHRQAGENPSPISAGAPLSVVSEDPINLDDAGVWTFPSKVVLSSDQLKLINAPPDANNPVEGTYRFIDLMYSLGGYQASTDTQLVVQNNQVQEIRVLDMHVVKSCRAPLTGTLIYSPNAGGDPTIQLGFNLDSPSTEAETSSEAVASDWKPDYFAGHTVTVMPGAQQVFNIRVTTLKQSCAFRFLLSLLVGSRKTYQLIDDSGSPFRISAIAGTAAEPKYSAYEAMYAGGVASPPRDYDRFVRVNPKTYNPLNFIPGS